MYVYVLAHAVAGATVQTLLHLKCQVGTALKLRHAGFIAAMFLFFDL